MYDQTVGRDGGSTIFRSVARDPGAILRWRALSAVPTGNRLSVQPRDGTRRGDLVAPQTLGGISFVPSRRPSLTPPDSSLQLGFVSYPQGARSRATCTSPSCVRSSASRRCSS